jgi:tRNA pseudouridine38-40 synthase
VWPLSEHYRATVEYDGTDFLGYQIQAIDRTVQGELEKCLEQVTQSTIRIDGAGRTDAGVHATGQVIAFNVTWRHTLEDLHRALNATLSHDIVVSDLKITDPEFHPRYSALSRTYQYRIVNQRWPSVLHRRYAYYVDKKLDVTAMNKACRFLLGSHDFASFGKPPQGSNTVRNVMKADWSMTSSSELTFIITANAFLYRMVRIIVGTAVQVGLGRLAVAEVENVLEARDLTRSAPPAPAHGLCLVDVAYPEESKKTSN